MQISKLLNSQGIKVSNNLVSRTRDNAGIKQVVIYKPANQYAEEIKNYLISNPTAYDRDIDKLFNNCKGVARRIRKKLGIAPMPGGTKRGTISKTRHPLTVEIEKYLLHNQHLGNKTIALKFKTTKSTIREIRKRLGILPNKPGGRKAFKRSE